MDETTFWNNVRQVGTCLEWQGARRADGYGAVRWKGRTERAHRLAWTLKRGDPAHNCVLHTCDNPPCINVEHLFLGNRLLNARDREAKGRRGRVHGALLSAVQVRTIRKSKSTPAALAKRYGVTRWNIYDILSRRTWRHTP